jgi:hypothetical protein
MSPGFVASALAGCAAVVLIAACGSSGAKYSTKIVLDRSIGPVSVREALSKVERTLGKGTTLHNDQHYGHYVRYAKLGLDVAYAPGPHGEAAFAILTTARRYRTHEGVGVGSTERQVAAIKGVDCSFANCVHGSTHNKPGTFFNLRNGKVWRVGITILD